MQELGTAITVLGILVTFVAYFGQHSGVSLADLEPGLVARWNRTRIWVRRKLRLKHHVMARDLGTALDASVAITATGMVWSPLQPGDDIAVRADKLERNLDSLRANVEQLRALDQQHAREVADGLAKQLNALEQVFSSRQEETRKASTAAMRWEVRGLLITLVGAGLSIFG